MILPYHISSLVAKPQNPSELLRSRTPILRESHEKCDLAQRLGNSYWDLWKYDLYIIYVYAYIPKKILYIYMYIDYYVYVCVYIHIYVCV